MAGTRPARGSSGGLDGLEDDAGHDRRLGNEGQVPRLDIGDVSARASAKNVSSAGGMTRSPVPITAQDGMVVQAGARTAR